VAAWWTSWPEANIGLRCDSLLVFDVDGEQGEHSLERLEHRFGRLPVTRTQRTGKGRHLLYGVPIELGNSTRRLGNPPGVDLRCGRRGYIVAAPSVHASGSVYTWVDPEAPVHSLPATYLEALARPTVQRSRPASVGESSTSSAYGRAALRDELERLLRVQEGERNETLNLAVFRMAQLVAGGELARVELERQALAVALLLGLERGESEKTIRSALRAGLFFPRAAAVGGTFKEGGVTGVTPLRSGNRGGRL
jgi:hypothetical protein